MIGVFDSGVGGLTVLEALMRHFPEEKFLYLGDNAYAPYGNRGWDEIYSLTRRGVEQLFQRGCGLVLIACNTACAVALRRLQQEWLPLSQWGVYPQSQPRPHNLVGVMIPLIEHITGKEWDIQPVIPYDPPRPVTRVGVFATKASVLSQCFTNEMARLAPELEVFEQACPYLAEAIEMQAPDKDIESGIIRYSKDLLIKTNAQAAEIIVLGCTHYHLVRDMFKANLPEFCQIVNQPEAVAASLKTYFARHPYYTAKARGEAAGVTFLTSGDPEIVSKTAQLFWQGQQKEILQFQHLDDYPPLIDCLTPEALIAKRQEVEKSEKKTLRSLFFKAG